MAALAAIFWKDGRSGDTDSLQRLAQGLRVFGGARQETATLGPCGLAFVVQGGFDRIDGPLICSSGPVRFAFEGRLDNRENVIGRLGAGAVAHNLPDNAVAFRSWLRDGPSALDYWVGSFAFVAFDGDSNELVAGRDHLGSRPLCYHDTPSRVVIASAPRIIHALPDVERVIDEQKIADQLVQMFHDGARTYYKGISRILPGHLLRIDRAGVRDRRYWSVDTAAPVNYRTDAEYVEAGRDIFDRAVRSQIGAGDRVGCFLSGGLDSSSIAVTALDHVPAEHDLNCYTWVPSRDWDGKCRPGRYGDETPFVEAIARMHPRIRLRFIRAESHGLFHRMDEFLDLAGVAPRNALNLCWIHDINAAARDAGLDVLLDGTLGNATLSWNGGGVLVEHWRNKAFGCLANDLVAGLGGPRRLVRRLLNDLVFPVSPKIVEATWRRLREGRGKRLPLWRRQSAIHPDFAGRMNVEARMQAHAWEFFASPYRDTKLLRRQLVSTGFVHERADILQAFRVMYGVDMRDPFADRRLVEWTLGVPESQFARSGTRRWLIKRIMQGRLPDDVLSNERSGEQIIDWHARLTWDLERIREEIEVIADDPETARLFDVDLMRQYFNDWPTSTPLAPERRGYAFVPVALGSAIAAAWLVRRTKGANR